MNALSVDFPRVVSLTVTNRCNLKCRMCGQWSEEGYMQQRKSRDSVQGSLVPYEDLVKAVDEASMHKTVILIRGGEPFLYPGIIGLISHIKEKGLFLSIDTNGTLLSKHAESIVRLKIDHLSISVDGPEEIHDAVRGVPGAFAMIRDSLAEMEKFEKAYGRNVSRSITCTLSRYNYTGLGRMPDVARSLGFKSICIVPYYYLPASLGREYEQIMEQELGCKAYSWRGFHHEDSGVDVKAFLAQLAQYNAALGDIYSYPYLPLSGKQYAEWYTKSDTTVKQMECNNIHGLLDVQPDGSVNFCVDFPDYVIGNIRESTLAGLWNSENAKRFRDYRDKKQLPVCYRCGAKYMA